jgi:hypothetical protein
MAVLLGYWEEDGEERESESSEREKEEGKWHGVQGLLQGVFSAFVGKQEVAAQVTCEPPRRSLARGGRNKREFFCRNPLKL